MMLRPWQQRLVTPDATRSLVIANDDEASVPPGRYTLKLWDEGGGQTVTVEDLEVL